MEPVPSVTLEEFLEALFPPERKGFLEVRALPSRSQTFLNPENTRRILRFLKQHEGDNLFFGVATRLEEGDGSLKNCSDLWALWCDIDFKILPEDDARRRLEAFPLAPSIVIHSGGGLHVYWLLQTCVNIQQDHHHIKAVLRRLAHVLGGDLSAAEPARILRLPDTLNYKYKPPRRVIIELLKPKRLYEFDEIEAAVPAETQSQPATFKMPERIQEGTRNTSLYKLSRSLRAKGLGEAAVLAAVLEENAEKGSPPLGEAEIRSLVTNAFRQPDRADFRPRIQNADRHHESAADGPVLVNLSDVEPEEVTWLWPARVARRKLNLIVGDPDLGKSKVTLDIASCVTTGQRWPDGGRAAHGHVVILTAEDGLADTVRPRVDALRGDASEVTVLQAVREGGREHGFNLARDLPALEQAIVATKAVLVIIDPISAYLGRADSFKDAEVRGVLAPLSALAERTGAAILAVMHLSKNTQRAALYRAQGSIAFVASARSVFAVAKDPEDEDRRLLLPIKLNIAARPPVLAFRHVGLSLRWDREPVANVDVEAVLRGGDDPEEGAALRDAAGFLRQLLTDKDVSAQEVFKEARANGISDRTLKRAKLSVGVRSRKQGSGKDAAWYWHLTKKESHERGPEC
jgi:hypothetical protein